MLNSVELSSPSDDTLGKRKLGLHNTAMPNPVKHIEIIITVMVPHLRSDLVPMISFSYVYIAILIV